MVSIFEYIMCKTRLVLPEADFKYYCCNCIDTTYHQKIRNNIDQRIHAKSIGVTGKPDSKDVFKHSIKNITFKITNTPSILMNPLITFPHIYWIAVTGFVCNNS